MTDNFNESIRNAIHEHFEEVSKLNPSPFKPGVHHELEFRFGDFITENNRRKFVAKLDLNKFKQIIGTLRDLTKSSSNLTEQKGSEITLDISLNQTKFLPNTLTRARASIPGSAIGGFCLTSNLNAPLELKGVAHKTDIYDWDLRLQSAAETQINDSKTKSQFAELVADPRYIKNYRLKKRLSFYGPPISGTKIPSFRVDATIVKESKASNFELSNIYGGQEHYELEIESDPDALFKDLPKQTSKEANIDANIDAMTTRYYDSIIDILRVMKSAYDDSAYPISEPEKKAVLCDFEKAFFPEKDIQQALKSEDFNPRRFFIGMEVNPLDAMHLAKNQKGDIPLLSGSYYITMKADGARYILYFPLEGDEKGRGYMIDRNRNVKYSGLNRQDFAGAAFDGEYIDSTNEFLIFDYLMEPGVSKATSLEGKDIRSLKFSERLDRLNKLGIPSANSITSAPKKKTASVKSEADPGESNLITPDGPVTLKVKEHYHIPKSDDFKTLGKIINRIELSPTFKFYRNDGYVFTPDEPYPIASLRVPVTWPNNLKWKPKNQLSIDFLVQKQVNSNGVPIQYSAPGSTNKFQTLYLFVGYRGVPKRFMIKKGNFKDGVDNIARVLEDEKGNIWTSPEDPDEKPQIIYNNTVVEFIWGELPSGAFVGRSEGWVPIRVREDKTQTRTPNKIETAASNWKLINAPISIEMLKGEEEIPAYYYMDVDDKIKLLVKPWTKFHNIVKSDLILGAATALRTEQGRDTVIRLLDLGVGRGGDLQKWGNARVKSALGIELFRNGLEGPGGAYERYEWLKDNQDYKVDVDFVWGDVSKNIVTLQAALDDYYRNILALSLEKNTPGFNIISCMFAIHYFMRDEAHLRGLFQNISELLLPGGYLVGITLDGEKVIEEFLKEKTNLLVGTKDKTEIWRLQKRFTTPEDTATTEVESEAGETMTKSSPYGRELAVRQITIGQEITEYLVNFDFLTKIAAEYGLEPASFGNFKVGGDLSNYEPFNQKRPVLSKAEKTYNDLNRYFIYKKVDQRPTALQIERAVRIVEVAATSSAAPIPTSSTTTILERRAANLPISSVPGIISPPLNSITALNESLPSPSIPQPIKVEASIQAQTDQYKVPLTEADRAPAPAAAAATLSSTGPRFRPPTFSVTSKTPTVPTVAPTATTVVPPIVTPAPVRATAIIAPRRSIAITARPVATPIATPSVAATPLSTTPATPAIPAIPVRPIATPAISVRPIATPAATSAAIPPTTLGTTSSIPATPSATATPIVKFPPRPTAPITPIVRLPTTTGSTLASQTPSISSTRSVTVTNAQPIPAPTSGPISSVAETPTRSQVRFSRPTAAQPTSHTTTTTPNVAPNLPNVPNQPGSVRITSKVTLKPNLK